MTRLFVLAIDGRAMRLRQTASATRLMLAAVFAVCLGVWLAMPPGFMPATVNGAPVIVPCPGSDGTMDIVQAAEMAMPAMPMGAHDGPDHHGPAGAFHQVCQYAAAASFAALDASAAPQTSPETLAIAPAPVPALSVFHRPATRERPPAQGPPAPA